MPGKWIAVIAIWALFLALLFLGERHARTADLVLISLYWVALAGLTVSAVFGWARLRRDPSKREYAFGISRGWPRWFLRFAADEKDETREANGGSDAAKPKSGGWRGPDIV